MSGLNATIKKGTRSDRNSIAGSKSLGVRMGVATEPIIKRIVHQIVKECSAKHVQISESCAAFMVKLQVLNPDTAFDLSQPVSCKNVEHLVHLCVDKLTDPDSMAAETIKMQVYYETTYLTRTSRIKDHRHSVLRRIDPLLTDVVNSQAKSREELERLYRRLVAMMILWSGLGNPTQSAVAREATAALQSVFPPTELGHFLSLPRSDREQQVWELVQIVMGIRLFNKDCQKGGEGIDDLLPLLGTAMEATRTSLTGAIERTMAKTEKITAALEIALFKAPPYSFDNKQLEDLKSSLILLRQFETYVRQLMSDLEASKANLQRLEDRFQKRLFQLHDTVRFHSAIPTVQVYPQFMDVAQTWMSMQNEAIIVSNLNDILWNLQKHTQIVFSIEETFLNSILGTSAVMTDFQRLEMTTDKKIASEGFRCEVYSPAAIKDFENVTLQYSGFCVWALAEGDGFLLPANPNMGVAYWKGKHFAFSSPEAAEEFDSDPERFVADALSIARRHPELVHFLQLQDQIPTTKMFHSFPATSDHPLVLKQNQEVQTELHPVESNIDPNYTWNEWELKRRALQLANICSSKTHSTQTKLSHFRRPVATQVYELRDKEMQTKRNGSSTVPRPQMFICGLRGQSKAGVAHVIDLTRPVHE